MYYVLHIYIDIYVYYIHICYHENNVPSPLSPQWLCGNSCTWAHDVHHAPKCMSCHKAIVVITGRPHCFHENIYITLILLFFMKTYILRSSIYLHLPGYISFIFNLIKRLHQIPRGGGCSWGSTKLAANAAKNLFWLRYSE